MAKQLTSKQGRNGQTKLAGNRTRPGRGARASSEELSKVTLYVRADQVIGIESIQLAERKRTGQRLDKSALVQEALDLLISKYRGK